MTRRWIGALVITLAVIAAMIVTMGSWASPAIAVLGGVCGIVKEIYLAAREDLRTRVGKQGLDQSQAAMILYFGCMAFICLTLSVILAGLRGAPSW